VSRRKGGPEFERTERQPRERSLRTARAALECPLQFAVCRAGCRDAVLAFQAAGDTLIEDHQIISDRAAIERAGSIVVFGA
jgi:hypothetical protein